MRRSLLRDPKAGEYTDRAIEPVTLEELEELELYNVSDAARLATAKETAKEPLAAVH